MKTTTFSLVAATVALLSFSSVASAGVITLDGDPTFTPADAFSNNTIMADTTIEGGFIHLQGGATITPATGAPIVTIKVTGNYSAGTGETFSLAYSFTADLEDVSVPVTYTIAAPSVAAEIGSPVGVKAQGTLMPGLHKYEGTIVSRPFPADRSGTFTASLILNFSGATPGKTDAAAFGSLDLNIQQIDFELDTATAMLETPAKAQNLSTRGNVGTGNDVLIGGFIITGTTNKQIVLRAIGPSLMPPDVNNPLLNPILELHDSTGALIDTNDNWKQNSAADQMVLTDNNLAPTNDAESALVENLAPGHYTAIVRGVGGTSGVALVETFDLDTSINASKLANISTRGNVGTGGDVMIGGLIVGGGGGGFATVIVRGLGPSLGAAGISNPLADPVLELHDADGNVIDSNDNWMDNPNMQTISDDHLAPTNNNESALYEILPSGNYTAVLMGANGSTGVGLVETYDLD